MSIEPRSVPLYPSKDIKIDPSLSSSISMSGELLCSFSSGPAIIRVQPVDNSFSYNTIELDFIDQETCIHVSNKSPKPIYFMKDQPIAYFDLRSIGYFDPSPAQGIVKSKMPHTYVTSFTSMVDSSTDCFQPNQTPVTDTPDPYLWLESDDPRRFQTDHEILETAIRILFD